MNSGIVRHTYTKSFDGLADKGAAGNCNCDTECHLDTVATNTEGELITVDRTWTTIAITHYRLQSFMLYIPQTHHTLTL